MRREDKVPAVIYGDKKPPIPITLPQREMTHRLHAGGFLTHLVEIEVNGEKIRLTTADGYTAPDPAKVDYYFGNLDERRVTWSRGRDLTLAPAQAGAPVNALAKAYVEVDGKPADEKTVWNRKLTYSQN